MTTMMCMIIDYLLLVCVGSFNGNLRHISVTWDVAEAIVADGRQWRTLVAQCAQVQRRT